MGTSAPSKGSPSSVTLVPEWVPDVSSLPAPPENEPESEDKAEKESPNQDEKEKKKDDKPKSTVVPDEAPRGRFGTTRGSLGKFGSTGGRDSLRSALGSFV